MVEREHSERRRGGLHSVRLSDGNGGSEQRWIINVSAWRGRIALLVAAVGFVTMGLATGQALVKHEIDAYCVEELRPPDGQLYQAMDGCAEKVAGNLERDMDGRFDTIESRLAKIETEIETAKAERARQHAEIINLLNNR
jgi:hypothetical protein